MNKRTIVRVLLSTAFLTATMFTVNAVGQTATAPHGSSSSTTQQVPHGSTNTAAAQKAAENNPACQQIISECKNLGYIVGEWKTDNGLWKDCFDPVVNGGHPTRDGKPEQVPVSQGVIQQCRASRNHAQSTQTSHTGTPTTQGMPKQ